MVEFFCKWRCVCGQEQGYNLQVRLEADPVVVCIAGCIRCTHKAFLVIDPGKGNVLSIKEEVEQETLKKIIASGDQGRMIRDYFEQLRRKECFRQYGPQFVNRNVWCMVIEVQMQERQEGATMNVCCPDCCGLVGTNCELYARYFYDNCNFRAGMSYCQNEKCGMPVLLIENLDEGWVKSVYPTKECLSDNELRRLRAMQTVLEFWLRNPRVSRQQSEFTQGDVANTHCQGIGDMPDEEFRRELDKMFERGDF